MFLDFLHDTEEVATPYLLNVGLAVTTGEQLTGEVEELGGTGQTGDTAVAVEVGAETDMVDADHLACDPYEIFKRTQVPGFPWEVPFGHKTSSRYGLRLVCEARPELGNIADNQICLARDLGLMGVKGSTGKPVVDDSCIDATRISYCPRREDIYHIDENKLINF